MPRARSPRWLILLLPTLAFCGGPIDDAEEIDVVSEELRTNTNANRLVVYSNNVENMIFDWNDLVHFMAEEPLRPDLFLLQQVSGKKGIDRMASVMQRRLGVGYKGVVAQNRPDDTRFQAQVVPRPPVTTGVIWRTKRFDFVSKETWMPWGRGFKNQPKRCDVRSNHSGYESIRVKLWDKVAKKHIVVVSLRHWTWKPCSTKNVFEIDRGVANGPNAHHGLGSQAALHIVAGDFNDRLFESNGDYKCWYKEMNRGLGARGCANRSMDGFTDPLFESCDGKKPCVRSKAGIDHIFVRRSDGKKARTSHYRVVGFDDAHRASVRATGRDANSNVRSVDGWVDQGENYSQHRARRAYVFYE